MSAPSTPRRRRGDGPRTPRPAPVPAGRGRGRPADPKAAENRRRILVDAALAVISRDGLAAAGTRAIAAEAGVNLAALHYDFASKDEVLSAVLAEVQRRVAAVLSDATAGAADVPEALRRAAKAYWSHVLETPEFQRVQYELTIHALSSREGEAFARRQYDGYIGAVRSALAAVPGADRVAALDELCGSAVAALDGLTLQYLALGDRRRAAAQLDLVVRALEAMLAAAPPGRGRL